MTLLFVYASAARGEPRLTFTPTELRIIFSLSPLVEPTRDSTNRVDGDPAAIALGARLFFDPGLSGSGDIACATCHDPGQGWQDGRSVAVGTGTGSRNSPTLGNVAHNRWFFWDGRADSLWSQALKPIENPVEMNGSRLETLRFLADRPALARQYEVVFGALPDASEASRFPPQGGPVSSTGSGQRNWWRMTAEDMASTNRVFANVGKALAAFVATIASGPAPFDRFVADLRNGNLDSRAIPDSARRGLRIFVGEGKCVLCHSGPNFTNNEFHDIRVPPGLAANDTGRLAGVSALLADEFVAAGPYSDDPTGPRARQIAYLATTTGLVGHFRTPSLRNSAATAPYMHAGQLRSLREVVEHYSTLAAAVPPADPAHVEALLATPLGLSDQEIDDLLAFLLSLSSEPLARTQ